jgi:hypothetical protein
VQDDTKYKWHVAVEPASVAGVAKLTAALTATLPDLESACYWISDMAEIGHWPISKATITRVPAVHTEV